MKHIDISSIDPLFARNACSVISWGSSWEAWPFPCVISDSAALLSIFWPRFCVKMPHTSRLSHLLEYGLLLAQLLTDWIPQLPKLETLFICSPRPSEDVEYSGFYLRIIQNAPNLKTILPGKMPPHISQHILPDPRYYKLLDRLVLEINSVESERVSLQIAEASPAPKMLHFAFCYCSNSYIIILQNSSKKVLMQKWNRKAKWYGAATYLLYRTTPTTWKQLKGCLASSSICPTRSIWPSSVDLDYIAHVWMDKEQYRNCCSYRAHPRKCYICNYSGIGYLQS